MIAPRLDTAMLEMPVMMTRAQTGIDNRVFHRRMLDLPLWLTDMIGETVLRCRCTNLSAGGLFAVAPIGFGLAVGQRYELRLSPEHDDSGSLLVGDSLGYATIIRTQLCTDGDKPEVSFAARFDSPQYLPV